MTKICRKCNTERSLDDFPKVPGCTDGHSWTCKPCVLKQNQARLLIKNPLETRPQYQAKVLFEQGKKKCSKCEEIKELSDSINAQSDLPLLEDINRIAKNVTD